MNSKDKKRYRYIPKPDMTAYELAILIKPALNMEIVIPDNAPFTEKEFEKISRHLEEIT